MSLEGKSYLGSAGPGMCVGRGCDRLGCVLVKAVVACVASTWRRRGWGKEAADVDPSMVTASFPGARRTKGFSSA